MKTSRLLSHAKKTGQYPAVLEVQVVPNTNTKIEILPNLPEASVWLKLSSSFQGVLAKWLDTSFFTMGVTRCETETSEIK